MRGHSLRVAGILLALVAGTAEAEQVTDVFFPFDSSTISSEQSQKLDEVRDAAIGSPGDKILLEAHADPRGTAPYNVGLTARRAEAVRDQLIARGVDKEDIVLVMYGEDGKRRETFAEDRRVGIRLTPVPLYSIIDDALPVATAVTWERPATTAEIEGPRPTQTARR